MLRLWHDEVYAGLFGTTGWLASGKGKKAPQQMPAQAGTTPAQLLAMLLDAAEVPPKPGSKLVITLAGPACPAVALPWSDAIRTAEEREAYARAHFEQSALPVNESYLVHAEFRHYGAPGMAYAVPACLLEELGAVAAERKLRLVNVMPVAATAYCAARLRGPGPGRANLILLVEEKSVSAITIGKEGLRAFDAEPAFGGPEAALRRLLLRLDVGAAAAVGIELWSPVARGAELEAAVKQVAPQSTLQILEPGYWRRSQ